MWPLPSKSQNTPVPCPPGSPGAGKSIAPYPAPLRFLGRWLDSTGCGDNGQPIPRIRRGRTMRLDVAHDLLWQIQGSLLVAYRLSRLPGRIASGEPLQVGTPRGNPPCSDLYLSADGGSWNAIQPSYPGFNNHPQDQLLSFDVDDRGIVYVATDPQGLFILQYAAADGSFTVLHHGPAISAERVMSVRSGDRYYLAAGDGGASVLYDVTDPSTPSRVGTAPSFDEWARIGDRVAFAAGGRLLITTASALVQGAPAQVVNAPGAVTSVTTSGDRFVATARSGGDPVKVWIEGSGWTGIDVRYVSGPSVRCNASYLVLHGDEPEGFNLRLYRIVGGTLTPVPLNTDGHSTFSLLYHNINLAASLGYAAPGLAGEPGDVVFTSFTGRTVILLGLTGVNDAWEIDEGVATGEQSVPTSSAGEIQISGTLRAGKLLTFSVAAAPMDLVMWRFSSGATNGVGRRLFRRFTVAGTITVSVRVRHEGFATNTTKVITIE